ncbi:MAG: S1 family peptidase [Deltaproteobacteria bacterium]|nr:S1 family peptidase [Deltaproteobacteria bacterium]
MRTTASTLTISLALALPHTGCDDGDHEFDDAGLDLDDTTDDQDEPDRAPPPVASEPERPAQPEDLWGDVDPSEIIGGVVWDSDRDVMVLNNGGICTGTLLRNNVVLTAKHCVSTDGTINGPASPAASLSVQQDGPGATLGATRSVTEIRRLANHDVAIMRLSSGMSVDGRTYGRSTQILATSQNDVVGLAVLCQGYGRDTCNGGSGTLRAGFVEVDASTNGMLSYVPWLGLDWIQWKGDSGSSCRFGPLDPPLQKALGVASTGNCGAATATEVGPQLYRNWAVDQMNDWAGNTFVDTFNFWQWLADIDEPTTMLSGPTQWQMAGGVLSENSNAHTNTPFHEGSRYVNAVQVASDATVRVTVSSADDDAAGLIVRYRDPTHYYRLSFDEQRRYARIVRRSGNNWTVIDEDVDFDIDWSTSPEISLVASGNLLAGFVDGQLAVLGFDDEHGYTAGRVGMYTWGLTGATFDDLEIERF